MKQKQKNIFKLSLVIIILLCSFLSYQISRATSISAEKLGELLNQERQIRKFNILSWNYKLYQAAQAKATYMLQNNYFEHYAPDGTSPWNFILNAGYDYKLAGENLAMDFSTSEAAHDAWMASPTHKDNILNPNYEDYAIYTQTGKLNNKDTQIVVELFGKPDNPAFAKTNRIISTLINYLLGKQINFSSQNFN